MSTFLGLVEEIPGISVDRFDDENLKSSAFFLSHCHTDHMVGLNDRFFDHLVNLDQYLYCSPISKAFLEGMHPDMPKNRVKMIEVCKPQRIGYTRYGNDVDCYLDVTSVPAGHCPGSVMFIFENCGKTILYTGDFRIDPDDLPKLKPLHFVNESERLPRTFDRIYLDTTFLDPGFPYLPSRKESCQVICDAAASWLNKDPKNMVVLECSALYGSEYLFLELSKLLKMRIHVKDKVYQNLSRIVELVCHLTKDGRSTRLHACVNKISNCSTLLCRESEYPPIDRKNILTVVPSTQRWAGKSLKKGAVAEWERNPMNAGGTRLYVCYSTHSSFEELKAFVKYFRPKDIYPSVCPPESMNRIYILLREIMEKSHNRDGTTTESILACRLALRTAHKIPDEKIFKSKHFDDDDDSD